ncbi:Outer membrane protein beta-barrel domain-containing protein [Chitinophaga jiangningensis]|uniref:Outer membrane protein beta-barrel domain-containing protein n=1 Tax=Chitinophaga jiangningensis TaxID=1419482 RepID=A0A1M7HQX3_9BACT|nr:outer membrane beta-barrel protein [Chitinophaga jiangningensis]SHM30962.1 Outer membrane protein beta-barrel domain-containing protein [Chitinophaga jiangningensis]
MKKLIVIAAAALFGTQVANAQISKGDFLVGGTAEVSTSSTKTKDADDKTTSTSFGISPKVGYALNSNWMVGVFVGTQFGVDKAADGTKNKSLAIAPGIFVRNYHMLGDSKFAFFAEGNAAYGFGNNKVDDTKISTTNAFAVNVQPGISYFVTKHFMVEGMFGGINYTWAQDKTEATGVKRNTSSFDFKFTQQFSLGVNFLF